MQAHHITSGKSINLRSLVTSLIHHDHSPTAIALGSSAIGKVWGQNRFRTLYGSLDQIRLGPPQGSAEGGSSSFVVSLVFWGRSVLGCQKVPRKVSPSFHQDSPSFACLWFSGAGPSWASTRFRGRLAKAPPRFHRGSTKVSSGIVKVLRQNDAFVFLALCSE